MPRTDLEHIQEVNLVQNFRHFKGERTHLTDVQTALGLVTIEHHDRQFGRGVYYAVHEGNPIAYCSGLHHAKAGYDYFLIQSTFVTALARRKGVGLALYAAIIETRKKLVSDYELSDGAQALWARLARDYRVAPRSGGFIAVPHAKEKIACME